MALRFRAVAAALLPIALAVACASRSDDDGPPFAAVSVGIGEHEVVADAPVDIAYRFIVASDAPVLADDYTVFVHFVDEDGEQLWTDDHEPPTPVRDWKRGATIEYTRTVFVADFPYEGEIRVIAGLYSPRTGDRLALSGEGAGMRSYRVGAFTMRRKADAFAVVFGDGWYDQETAESEGLKWRWSRQAGMLSFPNPKRPAELLLQLDQPARAFAEGQRVDVRLGPSTLDTFTLRAGGRGIRRIPLAAEQMGDGPTVEISLVVDRTFVPAALEPGRSADHRELGIRVFRAHVEPK